MPGEPSDYFKPEFINRIDEEVDALQAAEPARTWPSSWGVQLGRLRAAAWPSAASRSRSRRRRRTGQLHSAYDPDYGARPLRRELQRNI